MSARSKRAALDLAVHSFWAGAAVVAITLVAVALKWFGNGLILLHWIQKDDPVDWAIHICEYALLGIDATLLISVAVKLAWKFLKAI